MRTDHLDLLHQRVHETFLHRHEGPEARRAWQEACCEFHSYESPMSFVGTAEGRARFRNGEADLLEHAIRFLELDPYVFRSGYTKAEIIRCIKWLPFRQDQIQRLQGVVLRVIDKCDRNEFRAFCRLAAAVDSPDFERLVGERLRSADSGIRRRAQWVLEYLEQWRRSQAGARTPSSKDWRRS